MATKKTKSSAKKNNAPTAMVDEAIVPQMRAFFPCCGKWFKGDDMEHIQEQYKEFRKKSAL